MIPWLIALTQLVAAAMIGHELGAWIDAHDEQRRETRDAIAAVIDSSDVYRAEARRRVWAA